MRTRQYGPHAASFVVIETLLVDYTLNPWWYPQSPRLWKLAPCRLWWYRLPYRCCGRSGRSRGGVGAVLSRSSCRGGRPMTRARAKITGPVTLKVEAECNQTPLRLRFGINPGNCVSITEADKFGRQLSKKPGIQTGPLSVMMGGFGQWIQNSAFVGFRLLTDHLMSILWQPMELTFL